MLQYTTDLLVSQNSDWKACSEEEAVDAFEVDDASSAKEIVEQLQRTPYAVARPGNSRTTYRWIPDEASFPEVGIEDAGPQVAGYGRGGGRGRGGRRQGRGRRGQQGAGGGRFVPGGEELSPEQTYTVSEAAGLLNTTPRTIQRLAERLDFGRSQGPNYPILLSGGEIEQIRLHREGNPPGRPRRQRMRRRDGSCLGSGGRNG